jgi:hypothetical protein
MDHRPGRAGRNLQDTADAAQRLYYTPNDWSNDVQPNDWVGFLRSRLDSHETPAPVGGIRRGGWKLSYSDQPSAIFKARDKTVKILDIRYSLGLVVSMDPANLGSVIDVLWGSARSLRDLHPV